MYPVRIGFDEALSRICKLLNNGHDAEALVTSVFTFEKLMRRSLKMAILSRGFTSKQSDTLIGRRGFKDLKNVWAVFDRDHRTLPVAIGNDRWQHVPKAVEMRNDLVHGNRVYELDVCRSYANHVLTALKSLHSQVFKDYGRDPWMKLPIRRKPQLHWLPQPHKAPPPR
jgi:hypothetical protein